jgi:hypothetical protein
MKATRTNAAAPRSIWRELAAMDRADLALRLLLVALLLQPVGQRWVRPLASGVAALGLLSPRALRSPWLWLALGLLAVARIASGWPTNDNHAYLLAYWCLAAGLAAFAGDRHESPALAALAGDGARGSRAASGGEGTPRLADDRDRVLAWNGRVLVGLTFAFAVLWKAVLSPDFVDGRFFRVTLVGDPRFAAFTEVVVGVDADTLLELRGLVREHVDGVSVPWPGMPSPPPRLLAVAGALTAVTLAFEGAVALAFLAPAGWRIARLRHALLALFAATTYAVAPVPGFGWLLLSMGVAQCEPERRRARIAYLAAFAFVLLATRWPWLRLLADWRAPPA